MTEPTPETISAILRSNDTSPEALYPAQIGVFCDDCGTVHEGDYLVNDLTTQPERFEIARAHLRKQGWSCTEEADRCPECAAAEDPS
ncbi:hypothetical protein [Streptomyces olivaceiscleroticus]|uniref:Uncharacterized protein n=1 Tax=Streptomyces olivaceiscleroticus TaxID=68245 RepID=A0ABN1BMG7_9ACTN